MQQQWWQHKIILALGVLGAVIFILESVIATLIWPTYQMGQQPLAILTASDALYATGFKGMELVAGLITAVTVTAIWRYARYEEQTKFVAALQQFLLVWVVQVLLWFVWPLDSMTQAVIQQGVTPRDIVFGLAIVLLAVTIWRVGTTASAYQMISLTNGLHLFAILFVMFHILAFVIPWLGWPLAGFFDVLARDVLAGSLGLLSWYFMRLAD